MTQPQDREAVAADATELHEQGQAAADEEMAKAEAATDEDRPQGADYSQPLMGAEADNGALAGINPTSNESKAERGGGPLDYVTGADGIPLPAADNDPEMPGSSAGGRPQGLPEDTVQGQREEDGEAQESQPPSRSAPKADWVDHAVAKGVPQEEAEAMTKADLVSKHGSSGEPDMGEQQMRESGMPVANVSGEPSGNTGQSPGVNDT